MVRPVPPWITDCIKEIVGETLIIGAMSLVLFVTKRMFEALNAPHWAVHAVEQFHWVTFTVAVVWLALGTVATIVYPDLIALRRSLQELTDDLDENEDETDENEDETDENEGG